MENKASVNMKEVEKIIKTVSSAKKPSQTLLYFCIFLLALLALCVAINMHSHSVFSSIMTFSSCFIITTAGLIVFYLYINKVSIMSGLHVLNSLINHMSKNEWNYPFPRRNIHPLIVIHPVFRVIAGLYLCKVNDSDDGLRIIDKAATESAVINECVSQGEITDVVKFKDLTNIIAKDLMPGTTFKTVLKVFLAFGSILILIRLIVFIIGLLYEYLVVVQ